MDECDVITATMGFIVVTTLVFVPTLVSVVTTQFEHTQI